MIIQKTRGFVGDMQIISDLMRILDMGVMVVVGYAAFYVRNDEVLTMDINFVTLVLGTLLFTICANMFHLYESSRLISFKRQALPMLLALGLTLFCVIALLFFAHLVGGFSRLWLGTWFLGAFIGMLILRVFTVRRTHHRYHTGQYARRVVLLGSYEKIQKTITHLHSNSNSIQVVGACVLQNLEPDEVMDEIQVSVITDIHQLHDFCREGEIEEILITSDFEAHPEMDAILAIIGELPYSVKYCIPGQFFGRPVADAGLMHHIPVVTIFRAPLNNRQRMVKRIMDLILAMIALILSAPIFILVAGIIALDGQGHIFYRQARHGFASGEFSIFKFRSMKVVKKPETEIKQATRGDRRLTLIGAFIRRTSIDELPQLINVLKGSMSLVGPRPHALSHNQHYQQMIKSYSMRHRIKPGITGLAQVRGWRGETNTIEKMQKRVECDLYYIEHWSLWLDIKILIQTIFAVFAGKNAY